MNDDFQCFHNLLTDKADLNEAGQASSLNETNVDESKAV